MGDPRKSRKSSDTNFVAITDPTAIVYLANPANLECLVPFLGRELTLSQAAEELQSGLSRIHYQVNRLLEMNLLRITRVEPRAGRAIKHYSAVAERLFVPFDTTSFASLEEALGRAHLTLSRSLAHDLARHTFALGLPSGLCVSRGSGGGFVIEPSIAPDLGFNPLSDDAPAVIPGVWTSDLCLDFAEAKALQRELEAIRQRYSGRSRGQRYQMHMALVPVNEP